jgi:CheY-like chemotaxis protein
MVGEAWRSRSVSFDPILVLSRERSNASRLGEMLRGLGAHGSIIWAGSNEQARILADRAQPKLFFVDRNGNGIEGLRFVEQLRRSGFPCKAAPVILVSGEATVAIMREAQNAGAHEYLLWPYSPAQLAKRLDAISGPPRPWFETDSYVGPDRRRFNSAGQGRPERRKRPPPDGSAPGS